MGSGAGRCGKGDTVTWAALAAKPLPLSAMPMAEFPHLVPVILSGGSGTRLWPLSREAHPKQFLPLLGERSLLQSTWLRVQRSEEHTSELQSLMRISYAVFCLQKKNDTKFASNTTCDTCHQ